MSKKSANLYLQTEYSLLHSNISFSKLRKYLSYTDYKALAIVDNAMHGVYKFYKLCREFDVKPIIGLRLSLYNEYIENIVLLYAKNNDGYKSLMRIASMMAINPTSLTLEYLEKYAKDLVLVIPVIENEINVYYKNLELSKMKNTIEEYKRVFDDSYLGLSLQTQEARESIDQFLKIANETKIKPLAINKTNYFSDNDIDTYKVLRMVDKNTNEYELSDLEENSSFLSEVEMELLFNKYPFLIQNIDDLCEKCSVEINDGKYHFPKFQHDSIKDLDSKEYISHLCKAGLNKRLQSYKNINVNVVNQYKSRLLYELDIIDKMGFNDYFLIVYDYVKFAKNNDIYVGPGRGSAGGSLVSYCLGITDIDPLKYNLLFERFLNPERKGMPDIDVDFEDANRDEVIKYLGTKYGKRKVAHITTFGTFKAKLAVRDVSRILKLSDNKLKEVMKYISSMTSIEMSLENSSQLKRMYDGDEEIHRVIDLAASIENLPKNYSTHAAGIIMADTDLCDYCPLQEGIDGIYQTQYEASDLEELGLVKMDILGLRNLSIIKNVVNLVKEKQGIDINIKDIPLDDEKVYKNIALGKTLGIFQLEGEGVTKVLRNLKTSSLDDIVNATALYRPGPMEMIPSFVKRKFGQENTTYIDPCMEKVLKETYGVIVFQEQIIMLAADFAGYSLGEADVLRRAVSKKKAKLLEEERIKFVNKAISLGKNEKQANKVYDYIEKFASYGFNKSHAVAYSVIAYQMAYLKTYYYQAFMAALMTNFVGSASAISMYINDLRKNGLQILPPSINKSSEKFVYDQEGIYYSLVGINNVGNVIVNQILEERENGLYKTYEDFVFRTKGFLNKRIVSSLVYAGAMDEFILRDGLTKKYMVENYENILERVSYLDMIDLSLTNQQISKEEYSFEEISFLEKEAIGFNIKYNIFIKYNSYKEKYKCLNLSDLKVRMISYCIVCIKRIREITTKKGEKMAFLEISDESMTMDAVIFTNEYNRLFSIIELNKFYIIKGNADQREDKMQFVIEDLRKLK